MLDALRGILARILKRIIERYYRSIVCQHFCVFREGGSDLAYTHVHILGDNPSGATGLGHDDHTAPDDPKHNTVSDAKGCKFKTKGQVGGWTDLAEIPLWVEPGTEGGTIYPVDLNARVLATAYFHECPEGADCPPGYKKVNCKCRDEDGQPRNHCVCYTMDHDHFERWYEEQKWDDRVGEYRRPSINVRGRVPASISCGETITLYSFTLRNVGACDGFAGPAANNNELLRQLEAELSAIADKIECDGDCAKTIRETWRGWRCGRGGPPIQAEAAMQWEVKCEES